MNAIVIGGGIGGLTAAIALERAGVRTDVYERADRLREVGAGISLWANAVEALEILGLGPALRQAGWAPVRGSIRAWNGTVLTASSASGIVVGAMHRADLLRMLTDAIDPARLHLAHEFVGYSRDADCVRARFANGASATGDLLIGADGLHSAVRAQVVGAASPRYAGYTAWRGVVEFGSAPDAAGETWGQGSRFGIVPLNDARVYWFATANAAERGSDPAGQRKLRLFNMFRGWHAPIQAIIAATPESAILRNDIYDRDPLPRWSEGCVTLLGDAAHPMTPNLGQGACQAIEDAVVLAACLSTSDDVEAALRHYESRRIPRTSHVVMASRRIGDMAQWENPLACGVRDLLVRLTPASIAERQLRSVVEHELLSDEERSRLGRSA